jgi:hypothetical protein
MGNKLYVGNLSYTVRDEDLQQSGEWCCYQAKS